LGQTCILVHNANRQNYLDDWIPVADGNGKVHSSNWGRDVPYTVPQNMTKEELEMARDALKSSTQVRQKDFANGRYPDATLDSAKQHGKRLQYELNLLHMIERRLKEL
jgi:hypothetical protein